MPTSPTVPPKAKGSSLAFAALMLTILVWGVAPAIVRSFSLATGPADAVVIRTFSVAVFCLFFLPFLRGPRVTLNDWPRLLATSWLGMFGYFLGSIYGYAHVTSAVGGIIIATQPLLIALLAAVLGIERLRSFTVIGLLVSFAGTALLFMNDTGATMPRDELLRGSALVFASGISWAVYVVCSKPLLQKYGALKITVYCQLLCALPAIAFISSTTLAALQALDGKAWASLIYLSLLGSIITVATWNYAAARLRTSVVGASLYTIPLLAVLAGAVLLSEPVEPMFLLPAAVILGGVAIAQFGHLPKFTKRNYAFAAVFFAVLCWGMVPVATRYLVLGLPPETVAVLRVVPAGFMGLLILIFTGLKQLKRTEWQRIVIASIGGFILYQVLSIFGARHLPASWMGMLFGLEPISIAILSLLFAGEKLSAWLIAGIVLAFSGTIVLFLGQSLMPQQGVTVLGIVLVTLATLGWGIYTVASQPVSKRHGSLRVTGLTLGISAFPMLFFISPSMVQSLQVIDAPHWAVIAAVVIFCTSLSTFAWNFAVGHIPSALAGMFLYLQPLVAMLASLWLLDEQMSMPLLAGGGLIIAGVAVAQCGPLFKLAAFGSQPLQQAHKPQIQNKSVGL